jgi:hypothetical protein
LLNDNGFLFSTGFWYPVALLSGLAVSTRAEPLGPIISAAR